MAGGYYTALTGMQARLSALDRLASDIANAGTAGYKAERATTSETPRPSFDSALHSAIDVSPSASRLDLRSGTPSPTGRPLDVSIDGRGFFVVQTDAGERYTRNGRLARNGQGMLATPDGQAVLGESGPISIGSGDVRIDPDGTVRQQGAVAGKLRVVDFADPARLVRETALRVRNDGPPATPVATPTIVPESLEQSNVSIVERLAELTTASRTFEALQRALTVLMNDVDQRAINEFGKR